MITRMNPGPPVAYPTRYTQSKKQTKCYGNSYYPFNRYGLWVYYTALQSVNVGNIVAIHRHIFGNGHKFPIFT